MNSFSEYSFKGMSQSCVDDVDDSEIKHIKLYSVVLTFKLAIVVVVHEVGDVLAVVHD